MRCFFSNCYSFNKSINPFPSDVRSYPKGTVLLISCAYISGSDNFLPYSLSHCLMRSANAPATCGVAMEVPLNTAYFPSGYVDYISSPGATKSISWFELLKHAIFRSKLTAPTSITSE